MQKSRSVDSECRPDAHKFLSALRQPNFCVNDREYGDVCAIRSYLVINEGAEVGTNREAVEGCCSEAQDLGTDMEQLLSSTVSSDWSDLFSKRSSSRGNPLCLKIVGVSCSL